MKVVVTIARVLLGLVFFVFGLNGFLGFLPPPELNEQAGSFMQILVASQYISVVKIIEIVGGAMLLAGRFVPLGLTLLGPVVVNILLFHTLLDLNGLPVAAVVTVLEFFLVWAYRGSFAGVFSAKAGPSV